MLIIFFFLLIHFQPIEFAEDTYGETGKFICTDKWIIKFNFAALMIYIFLSIQNTALHFTMLIGRVQMFYICPFVFVHVVSSPFLEKLS